MSFLERFFMTFRSPPKRTVIEALIKSPILAKAGYVPVVGAPGTQSAHENDIAAALAGAGLSRPSDLGSFEPPSLEQLASSVRALTAAHNDLSATMQLPQHIIPAA